MADQVEELIKEIAAKHGIAVSRDDPILILQTINARLMQDSAKAQQVMLDQYKEELEALALRWGNDAKTKAERILNVSLAASKEARRSSCKKARRKRQLRCAVKSMWLCAASPAQFATLGESAP
jgi:hypothetical protein